LFETHNETEQALGLPAGALTWRGPFEPERDLLWRKMLAGEISERDYWRQRTREVAEQTGNHWKEMSEFLKAARGACPTKVIRPQALVNIDITRAAGKKLAILSNELNLFYGAGFRSKLSILHHFNVIHDATYTKTLKPDPRAYTNCVTPLDVPASACVFVDDQQRNVAGAQLAGLQAVHFDVTQPDQSYAEALGLLGLNA
jgi:putative hydrolase of the HAD superfamily